MRRLFLNVAIVFFAACLAPAGDVKAQDARTLVDRGSAWDAKGEHDKAIADYNQALQLDPNYWRAYNERGNAWASKGEFDKAIDDFTQAIRLRPNDGVIYCNRGASWREKAVAQ